MAAPYSGGVTTSQVGSYFVGQYYQVLQTMPDCAHQFYNDASSMILIDGDSSQTASGTLQIYTLLTSLNFTGIEIKTINSLESWDGGILVMVSGSLKTKDFHRKRKFVQSFFLAPQEKGYFVLNDIFQFIDVEAISQPPAVMEPENKFESEVDLSCPVLEQPVLDYSLEEEAGDYMKSVCIEDDTVDKYSLPDHQELPDTECETVVEETPVDESSASLQSALNTEHVNTEQDTWADAVEEPAGEPERKTYASILRVSKGQSAPVVAQPAFRMATPSVSDWQHVPEPTAQLPNTASHVNEAVRGAAEEGFALEEEGEFKSVYVKSLPLNVTARDIEDEFKNFGTIKPDGVFIRSRKDIGVCYAFVEFEDIVGVHNAIKASPIQLGGKQVIVEERRANSSGSRGGRRGRGRGNYQSEAPRGRSAALGSGRGTNSNPNGSEYQRPRGNGFYQRSSRQGS